MRLYPTSLEGFTIPEDSTRPRLTTLVSILSFSHPDPCSYPVTVLLSVSDKPALPIPTSIRVPRFPSPQLSSFKPHRALPCPVCCCTSPLRPRPLRGRVHFRLSSALFPLSDWLQLPDGAGPEPGGGRGGIWSSPRPLLVARVGGASYWPRPYSGGAVLAGGGTEAESRT